MRGCDDRLTRWLLSCLGIGFVLAGLGFAHLFILFATAASEHFSVTAFRLQVLVVDDLNRGNDHDYESEVHRNDNRSEDSKATNRADVRQSVGEERDRSG